MINDIVIVDAVAYPWNMSQENQTPDASNFIAAVHGSNKLWIPDRKGQVLQGGPSC